MLAGAADAVVDDAPPFASVDVGTTDAVAMLVFSDFVTTGTVSFWPNLSVLVLVRLFARLSSPTVMFSSFAIFQSESPFLTTYARATVVGVAGWAVAAAAAPSFAAMEPAGASEFAAPGPSGVGVEAT